MRTRCKGTCLRGWRRGRPCLSMASLGSKFCPMHKAFANTEDFAVARAEIDKTINADTSRIDIIARAAARALIRHPCPDKTLFAKKY